MAVLHRADRSKVFRVIIKTLKPTSNLVCLYVYSVDYGYSELDTLIYI